MCVAYHFTWRNHTIAVGSDSTEDIKFDDLGLNSQMFTSQLIFLIIIYYHIYHQHHHHHHHNHHHRHFDQPDCALCVGC